MATTIYKYIDHQWVDNFFAFGQIKIGTLFYYTDEETLGNIRGDRDEGIKKLVMEYKEETIIDPTVESIDATFLKEEFGFIFGKNITNVTVGYAPGAELISNHFSPNIYTFCTASEFDLKAFTDYGDSCYEIFNAERFFAEITAALKLKRKVTYQGFYPITYCNREFDYRKPNQLHPALIKLLIHKCVCIVSTNFFIFRFFAIFRFALDKEKPRFY